MTILGRVADREATIALKVLGPGRTPRRINAVVDTGYNGHLTLPQPLVSSLRLPFAGHRRGTLADGTSTLLEVYLAAVVWHGREQEVLVLQTAGAPLVGMALLEGSRVTLDATEGGAVRIEELPQHHDPVP